MACFDQGILKKYGVKIIPSKEASWAAVRDKLVNGELDASHVLWGLIYGVILCNARAMGEFGAVSVVSGHIRGQTNTLPLHVEILYNEYQSVAAFAVASLLAILALVTLAIKSMAEWRHEAEMKAAADLPPERPQPQVAVAAVR